jgi:hypothetical protein
VSELRLNLLKEGFFIVGFDDSIRVLKEGDSSLSRNIVIFLALLSLKVSLIMELESFCESEFTLLDVSLAWVDLELNLGVCKIKLLTKDKVRIYFWNEKSECVS